MEVGRGGGWIFRSLVLDMLTLRYLLGTQVGMSIEY